ncbi:MAG: hypothetical protein IJB81_10905 [Clostridia bacterium]|nr:hypothetical protein [Clostridia bacterium]
MRSNKLNATQFLLKRNLFIGVMVFLIVFFTLPFWGLAHIPNAKENIMTWQEPAYQAESLKNVVTNDLLNSQNLESWVVLFGTLGFLTAMMMMRHLFSRRQGMLHAALPDKRETDFLRRIIGYMVLCLAPIVLNMLLYLLVVAVNGLLPYVEWAKLLAKFGMMLLINLYGFAIGLLASVLTGTYWAALLAGAVLIVGAEGLAYLWNYLAGRYLHTMITGGVGKTLVRYSPAFSLYKGLYRPAEFTWVPAMLGIVAAVGLSFVLYRIRKAEATERTLAFGWLHTLMGFILPLMGGSIVGIVVFLSFLTELSLIIGMVLGVLLTYWICRMIFNQRFCGILKQWYLPAAAALVLILGVVVLHTDVFGYDHFMPERDKLTAISYRPQSYHTNEIVTLTSDEALDAAYGWCTLMRDEVDSMENGIYANTAGMSMSRVAVTYHFEGRTVRRMYPNSEIRNDAQPYLQAIIDSDDYKQSLIRESHLEDGTIQNVYVNSYGSMFRNDELFTEFGVMPSYMNLDKTRDALTIDKWMKALHEDIQNRTFADKKMDPIFSLSISTWDEETGTSDYTSVDIFPSDINFLELLLGDKCQDVIDYATGGYAADEDVVALQVTYNFSRKEMADNGLEMKNEVKSIKLASSPEEAVEWVRCTQSRHAGSYYFMPDYEDKSFSRLYLYRKSELEMSKTYNSYEIPEDLTQLYTMENIPVGIVRDFVGK